MDIVKHGQDGYCKAWPRWILKSMAKMDIEKHGQDGYCKAWPRWIL